MNHMVIIPGTGQTNLFIFYFLYIFLFQEAHFSIHQRMQLLELALVLFLLIISISDCLCLAHIVEIRMNLVEVLFRDRSAPSYFSRKLFEFGAYANSLDHLDRSHGVLAVFCNKKFISGSKFFLPINEGSC